MNKNATIKNFDLNDAIERTVVGTNMTKQMVELIVKQFLKETERGLAEHGAVHYMNHFSVKLKNRAARKGTIKVHGVPTPWSTAKRVEPEFEASARLKQLIEEKQGLPCA